MKTNLFFFLVFLFSTSLLNAQQFEKSSSKDLIPEVKCYSSGKIEDFHVPARNRTKSSKEPTAVFEITYTGFSEEAKTAFQAAADIWSYLISSPVPITIDAHWEVMESGILGSSGSPEVFKNFKNALFKDTWYKPTIANRLSGYDLNPEDFDMITRFNSDFYWYLGTDGAVPYNQIDFVTIVLHEIGHSLGFNSNAYKDGTEGSIGWYTNGRVPMSFDHFMYNGSGELLIDGTLFQNPSPELLAEFTSNDVFFDSPLSNAANGGTPAELFAPSTWNGGSSISHLAEIYNGTENALMTYSLGTGEAEHDPGNIVMGMLAEQGWVSVRFDHDHLKDIETWSAPITVSAEIFADTALYDNSVFLHYSIDNFTTDNKVLMTTLNDTLFTVDIPVQVTDTLWYYMEAKSKLDRYYFYPSQGEGSINAAFTDSSLYFVISDSELPTVPTSLTMNETTDSTISLIWQASTDNVGVTAYEVYKNNVLLDQTTDTTYQAIGLSAATTYSFFVKAKDAAGNISEASNTINSSTTSTVNIEKFTNNIIKYIKIYPNPNNGYFNMEFESEEIINELNISIYSIDGKLVYSSDKLINDKFIKEQINVKNMNEGIYIIKLNTGKDIITERLLIK